MKKKSLSYEKLMGIDHAKLEAMTETGKLDDETLARIRHIGRFFQRLGNSAPNPNLAVGDVHGETDLQKIWEETAADDDDAVYQRPLSN